MESITSDAEWKARVAPLLAKIALDDTEDTWETVYDALIEFQALTKSGGARVAAYVPTVRRIAPDLTRALLSDRTKLTGAASDVINSMAPRLGDRFAGLLPMFFPALVTLCARSNKVMAKRAEKSMQLICRHCQLPGAVPHLVRATNDKNTGVRVAAIATLIVLVESSSSERLDKRVPDIEQVLREHAGDASGEVRQLCRTLYSLYAAQWPQQYARWAPSLPTTTQRYLGTPAPVTLAQSVEARPALPMRSVSTPSARAPATTVPQRAVSYQPPRTAVRPEAARATATHARHARHAATATPREVRPARQASASPPRSASPPAKPALQGPALQEPALPEPPRRFATPSEGVAYRLALAQQQARARSEQRDATRPSRALLPTATTGAARRVKVGKSEPSARAASPPPASLSPPVLSTTPSRKPYSALPEPSENPLCAGAEKKTDPLCAASPVHRAQFTPQRRPFGVVNDSRTESPYQGERPYVAPL